MPAGRWKLLAALGWGVTLILGRLAAEEPPPVANRFEVLPGLTEDAPASTGGGETHASAGDQSGIYLSADYLLLKPQRGDLEFAILNRNQSGHPDGTVGSGTTSACVWATR